MFSPFGDHFDAVLVTSLDRSLLPADWRGYLAPAELQSIGNSWIASGVSAVLEVPSALVKLPHQPAAPGFRLTHH